MFSVAERGPGRAVALLALLVVACGSGIRTDFTSELDVEYRPGAFLDVYTPQHVEASSAVLLLHGCCGDRSDLIQLAVELVEDGHIVVNASWTTLRDGGGYPVSYEDVACAAAVAVERAGDLVATPGITIVAWDDGALLAGVVAQADMHPSDCGAPRATPAAVIGLGGFYGWEPGSAAAEAAAGDEETLQFFGGPPDLAREAWRLGNPYTASTSPPPVEFWAVVGRNDELLDESDRWIDHIRARGGAGTLEVIRGANHTDVIAPRTPAGARVLEIVGEVGSRS
jgi:hypothetical protein